MISRSSFSFSATSTLVHSLAVTARCRALSHRYTLYHCSVRKWLSRLHWIGPPLTPFTVIESPDMAPWSFSREHGQPQALSASWTAPAPTHPYTSGRLPPALAAGP